MSTPPLLRDLQQQELLRWSDHSDLHGWMNRLYRRRGGQQFILPCEGACKVHGPASSPTSAEPGVQLTRQNILDFQEDVQQDRLPPPHTGSTSGSPGSTASRWTWNSCRWPCTPSRMARPSSTRGHGSNPEAARPQSGPAPRGHPPDSARGARGNSAPESTSQINRPNHKQPHQETKPQEKPTG